MAGEGESQFTLTSRAIPPAEDGVYDWNVISLLIPHEALRREFQYTKNALVENFDVATHPWKAIYFREWYEKFLLPVVMDHHDIEERIFFPFYQKLGMSADNE